MGRLALFELSVPQTKGKEKQHPQNPNRVHCQDTASIGRQQVAQAGVQKEVGDVEKQRNPSNDDQRLEEGARSGNKSSTYWCMNTSTCNYWSNLVKLLRGDRLLRPLVVTYYVTTRCNLDSVCRVTTWMTFSRPLVLWGPLLVPTFAWLARGPVGAIVMAIRV